MEEMEDAFGIFATAVANLHIAASLANVEIVYAFRIEGEQEIHPGGRQLGGGVELAEHVLKAFRMVAEGVTPENAEQMSMLEIVEALNLAVGGHQDTTVQGEPIDRQESPASTVDQTEHL